jgi:hypothetical protein
MRPRRGTKGNPFVVGERVQLVRGTIISGAKVGVVERVQLISEGGWNGDRPWSKMLYDVRFGAWTCRNVASRDLEAAP